MLVGALCGTLLWLDIHRGRPINAKEGKSTRIFPGTFEGNLGGTGGKNGLWGHLRATVSVGIFTQKSQKGMKKHLKAQKNASSIMRQINNCGVYIYKEHSKILKQLPFCSFRLRSKSYAQPSSPCLHPQGSYSAVVRWERA